MNRRIKFRIWSPKESLMIDWGTLSQSAFNDPSYDLGF